jgi:hypothetical protein
VCIKTVLVGGLKAAEPGAMPPTRFMSRLKSVDFYKKIPRYINENVYGQSTAPL